MPFCPAVHLGDRSLRIQSRLSLPTKPVLSVANLGGLHDYPELGSKYKGCHVKVLLWWMSFKSQEVANGNPGETWVFDAGVCFFQSPKLQKNNVLYLVISQPPLKWCDQKCHSILACFGGLGCPQRIFLDMPKYPQNQPPKVFKGEGNGLNFPPCNFPRTQNCKYWQLFATTFSDALKLWMQGVLF